MGFVSVSVVGGVSDGRCSQSGLSVRELSQKSRFVLNVLRRTRIEERCSARKRYSIQCCSGINSVDDSGVNIVRNLVLERKEFASKMLARVKKECTFENLGLDSELGALSEQTAVEISMVIEKVRSDYYILGRTRTSLKCNCDRCLEEFEMDSKGQFEIWLATNPSLVPETEGDEDERADEAIEPFTDDIHSIDLTSHVYDAVMLSIPYKKVCNNDCKGLWNDSYREDPQTKSQKNQQKSQEPESVEEQLQKLKRALEKGGN
uniref:DUF177 domain-containing protein n=1 Tax=Timspurckia oligopyrenoides TaxID=708627 RepID=A0A7S0ZEK2_9RHOD|mmetsp:Transcript_2246/g.3953  ORF Transcript_2246/g.3953 Transcript_2246/m.3953 type:complete len:262 (+) Transcript_2246:55-840(+)